MTFPGGYARAAMMATARPIASTRVVGPGPFLPSTRRYPIAVSHDNLLTDLRKIAPRSLRARLTLANERAMNFGLAVIAGTLLERLFTHRSPPDHIIVPHHGDSGLRFRFWFGRIGLWRIRPTADDGRADTLHWEPHARRDVRSPPLPFIWSAAQTTQRATNSQQSRERYSLGRVARDPSARCTMT